MKFHRYTYVQSRPNVSQTNPDLGLITGLDELKKPDDLWRIIAWARANVVRMLGKESFEAARFRLLEAYRSENRNVMYDLLNEYSGDLPDLTTEVVQNIAYFAPKYKQVVFNGAMPDNSGFTLYGLQDGEVVAQPENREYQRVDPDVLDKQNPNLSAQKLLEIQRLYDAFLLKGRYNSLQSLLTFANHCHHVAQTNPDLYPQEILPAYSANILQNLHLSKGSGEFGGSCIDHAYYFVEALKQRGVDAHVLGHTFGNVLATRLNQAEDVQFWHESLKMMEYSHTAVVVHCTLEPGQKVQGRVITDGANRAALRFEMGVGTSPHMEAFIQDTNTGAFTQIGTRQPWFEKYDDIIAERVPTPYDVLTQSDTEELQRRAVRAHLRSTVHRNPDADFNTPSDALRVNFEEGVIRLVCTELPTLREFYMADGSLDGIEISPPNVVLPRFYTSSTLSGDRSKITQRGDALYQIKFDMKTYVDNPDKKVIVVDERNNRIQISTRQAFMIFCKDLAKHYKVEPTFVRNMLYIFDNYEQFMTVFYQR